MIQILICSTWNVVKFSLTHPHPNTSTISLLGWGRVQTKR
nr:MAG TPA: hypothetical protein [Crassvirales sp.]